MPKVKESVPKSKASATPVVEQQPRLPEKKGGPAALVQRATASAIPMPGDAGATDRALKSTVIQRSVGNARLNRMLNLAAKDPGASDAEATTIPQRSTDLTIGAPNSPAEKEAEAVAQRIAVDKSATRLDAPPGAEGHRINRQLSSGGGSHEVRPEVAAQAIGHHGPGSPLAPAMRGAMESRLGADLSNARIHADAAANEAAGALNARAFTQGKDVFLARGESQSDTRLMAHEMTHVVQQGAAPTDVISREAGPKKDAPKATPVTSGSSAKRTAPPGGDIAPGVVELKGNPDFTLDPATASFIDEHRAATVNARFGKLAQGPIQVRRTSKGQYAANDQPVPLTHPLFTNASALPDALQPTLIVSVHANKLKGEVGLGKIGLSTQLGKLQQLHQAFDAMGLRGFDLSRFPKITNTIEGSSLHVGLTGIPFRLGGVFQGKFSLDVVDDKISFDGSAVVNVKGLATGTLELKRAPDGLITGKANVGLNLPKNVSGTVDVAWDGQAITGEGKVGYQGEKLSGEIILRLMDRRQAEQLKQEKQAPPAGEGAAKGQEPARAKRKEPIDYVVFGEGDLTFSFTEWLNGTAHVIVDHRGYLTIVGKITPQKEYVFLEQKDYVKPLFKAEARASYGIPVVGNIFIFANASMDAFAKLGPGKLYNIVVEGKYSTDPKESKNFSIQASLNVSAAAGVRLRGEAGAGLEILAHDIKAGAGINGIAGIRGYAEATPVIGYREKAKEGEDKKGEFFIRGDLEIAAQPFLGLSGDLFVEIDAPWWSPVPDKKWTWPLFNKEWPLGGSFGMLASVDYVFGSKEFPKVAFKPVEFSADKFFSDLYHDKAQPKSKEAGDQKGEWKERNSKEAELHAGGGKGEVTAGKAPAEMPAGKPKVQPGGPKGPGKAADPNAKTAEGKSVKELQEEAAKKKKKPEGNEVAKLKGVPRTTAKDREEQAQEGNKAKVTAKDEKDVLHKGMIPKGLAAHEIKSQVLDAVQDRLEKGDFSSIKAVHKMLQGISDANRDRGLRRLTMRVEDTDSMKVLIEASASSSVGRRIAWSTIFSSSAVDTSAELDRLRERLSKASQTSYAAVAVDGRQIGSVTGSRGGIHAEEAVVQGQVWLSAVQATLLGVQTNGSSRLTLLVNRTPCVSCVVWLTDAIRSAKDKLGSAAGSVSFTVAATGTYRRQARLKKEDKAALKAGSMRMAKRLGRPFDEVYKEQEEIWLKDLRSFSTEWVDDDDEEYSGLTELAIAGWQIAGLDAGQPVTPRQLELSETASRLADAFGWDS